MGPSQNCKSPSLQFGQSALTRTGRMGTSIMRGSGSSGFMLQDQNKRLGRDCAAAVETIRPPRRPNPVRRSPLPYMVLDEKATPLEHDLRSLPAAFSELVNGTKTFEMRVDDKPYTVGDTLRLREWVDESYTGRTVTKRVSHTLRDMDFLPKGFVLMALVDVNTNITDLIDDMSAVIRVAEGRVTDDTSYTMRERWLTLADKGRAMVNNLKTQDTFLVAVQR